MAELERWPHQHVPWSRGNACKSFAESERQQFDRGAALTYIYLEQF